MIGVFDSGIGGLTVVKQIRNVLPALSITYLGDTAHLPYGSKSKEAIRKFSIRNTRFLVDRGAEMIIVACHSSASVAQPELRRMFDVPIFTVVEAGARAVAKVRPVKVGVIGTVATIESGSYIQYMRREGVKAEIIARSCPLMVSIVEEGLTEGDIARGIVEHYLADLRDLGIGMLLLGCTHFPMLIPVISEVLPDVELIDPGHELAKEIVEQGPALDKGSLSIYLTDLSPGFRQLSERFLGQRIDNITRVTLEE